MRRASHAWWLGRAALAAAIVTIALPASAPPATAQSDPPLAVLMALEGQVRLVRLGGEDTSAHFGTPLGAGDEIRTGPDSSADILFASGQSIHLGAGGSVVVQGPKSADPAGGPGGGAGGGGFDSVQRYLKLKDSRGTSSIASLRSAAGPAELLPLGPCQTRVRGGQPTFRWRADPSMGELALTVYHDGGVHWRTSLGGGSQLAYPADAPALQPGVRYSWTVETTDPLRFPPSRSKASFFEVVSADERAAVDRQMGAIDASQLSETGRHLVRASVLYEHGLLEDAVEATRSALADDAQNSDLRAILARLYVETGRITEAVAEYDQLLEPR